MYVCICMYACMHGCMSDGLSVRPVRLVRRSVSLSVCRSVGLSVCRSVGLSVCRSVCMYVYVSIIYVYIWFVMVCWVYKQQI